MDVSPGHNHDGLKKAAKGAIGSSWGAWWRAGAAGELDRS